METVTISREAFDKLKKMADLLIEMEDRASMKYPHFESGNGLELLQRVQQAIKEFKS